MDSKVPALLTELSLIERTRTPARSSFIDSPTTKAASPTTAAPLTTSVATTISATTDLTTAAPKETAVDYFSFLGENLISQLEDTSIGLISTIKKEPIDELTSFIPTLGFYEVIEVFDQLASNTKTFFVTKLPAKVAAIVQKVVKNGVKNFGDNNPLIQLVRRNWKIICKVIWWPYHDDHCTSMRCSACSPAIMTSAQVCKKSIGRVSQTCISEVIGKNANCDSCISDFMRSY